MDSASNDFFDQILWVCSMDTESSRCGSICHLSQATAMLALPEGAADFCCRENFLQPPPRDDMAQELQKIDDKVFNLQATLIEQQAVTKEFLEEAGVSFQLQHLMAVVEERAHGKRCGWPICSGQIPDAKRPRLRYTFLITVTDSTGSQMGPFMMKPTSNFIAPASASGMPPSLGSNSQKNLFITEVQECLDQLS